MRMRALLALLPAVLIAGCSSPSTTITPAAEQAEHSPTTTPPTWHPGAPPQPITRLGAREEQDTTPSEEPTVITVTHTPAPPASTAAPQPAQPLAPTRAPGFALPELPAPPRIPTSVPLPPEVESGLAQLPTLPPLPRAEDIRIF